MDERLRADEGVDAVALAPGLGVVLGLVEQQREFAALRFVADCAKALARGLDLAGAVGPGGGRAGRRH